MKDLERLNAMEKYFCKFSHGFCQLTVITFVNFNIFVFVLRA